MRIRLHRSHRDRLDCNDVARVLQPYLDGELDATIARRVARHLDDCLRCGMEAGTYQHLKEDLARMSGPVDPMSVERLRSFVEQLMEDPARH